MHARNVGPFIPTQGLREHRVPPLLENHATFRQSRPWTRVIDDSPFRKVSLLPRSALNGCCWLTVTWGGYL